MIYTAPFKWAKENLFEFLWRFNHLSAVDRGHDATVYPAEDNEAEVALPKLRAYHKFENVQRDHLHRILIWDDRAPNEEPRRYNTPSDKWVTEALIGRATFGYVAYDIESGNIVFLKDFWRSDHPEIQKEWDVCHELQQLVGRRIAMTLSPRGVLQSSERIVYDAHEAVVRFFSVEVNGCMDEPRKVWESVSKTGHRMRGYICLFTSMPWVMYLLCVVVNMAKQKQCEDVRLLPFDLQVVEFTYASVRIAQSSTTLLMPNVGLYTLHPLQGLVTDRWF